MHKSIAKQLYEIATYKDDLACTCNIKAKDVNKQKLETTWLFEDNSTLSLNDFGAVKINGKWIN